ncbi:hypothetical protein LA635_0411 [Erwinia amylovora LA635]|nr:hypothetical protein LA635_0411 [Erwinia amylovora LA635]CDK17402.1 hypothetical protein LA636_0410 [Erwinia amylovora LA636]CDK20771.1 hypothetical protein LA637_0411 [Erwinia amylovora LA637]
MLAGVVRRLNPPLHAMVSQPNNYAIIARIHFYCCLESLE